MLRQSTFPKDKSFLKNPLDQPIKHSELQKKDVLKYGEFIVTKDFHLLYFVF